MSLGEDWIADHGYDKELLRERIRYNQERGIWIQKDGTEISIKDMTKSHIRNTIAMLKKNGGMGSTGWIAVFEEELANRDYIRKCVNEDW